MEWIPIEKYDSKKFKPENCVFFVKEEVNVDRPYATLGSLISTNRYFGRRLVTHYIELPPNPKD